LSERHFAGATKSSPTSAPATVALPLKCRRRHYLLVAPVITVGLMLDVRHQSGPAGSYRRDQPQAQAGDRVPRRHRANDNHRGSSCLWRWAPEQSRGALSGYPAELYKFWYTIAVNSPTVLQVHPLSEVRQRLSGILARFRREGAAAEPVAFGSHRKPEAILLPYEVYERYEALSRQHTRLDSALAAAQSVQAELPGPFSPDHDREVAAYVDGEISAAELYRRTVARYRQP
jgi:hypothetical protein